MSSVTGEFAPTLEQQAVMQSCATGANLVVEAAAGAGKTSTLRLAARQMRGRILYVAYNKAAATEAKASFPSHVRCSTVHALAYGAVGRQHATRLAAPRQSARQTAAALNLRDHVNIGEHLVLTPAHVARLALAMVNRFCQSADPTITERHLPIVPGLPSRAELGRIHRLIPELRAEGDHEAAGVLANLYVSGLAAQHDLTELLLPVARRAWLDVQDPHGRKIRFEHDHYLKLWQLTQPHLPYDVVMLDEAQDSNPVTADLVIRQQHAQRIAIGDSCQQLYAWRGAVDALADWPADHRLYLTQSWRFGPAIAAEANKWLTVLGTTLRVRGNPELPSLVGPVAPTAVLCRSNAGAVARVLAVLDAEHRPALVGGAGELVRLAEAAEELRETGRTSHPELFAFKTWQAVQDFASEEAGADLRPFVKLVDDHGPAKIIGSLSCVVPEDQADVTVSTAHKAKGREWDRVEIHDDFPEPKAKDGAPPEVSRADAMLAYVAVTRARLGLNRRGLTWIDQITGPAGRVA